jgi:hypothetical protein
MSNGANHVLANPEANDCVLAVEDSRICPNRGDGLRKPPMTKNKGFVTGEGEWQRGTPQFAIKGRRRSFCHRHNPSSPSKFS